MQERSLFSKNTFPSVVFFFFIAISLFPQERIYNLDEIVVTAGRTAGKLSEATRDIQIISQKEIEIAPVNSVQDLLQYISGVDIKQRGVEGVQADISLRGGTFEQTLIMLDGISVNDPQTAHHNLNLPVSLDQIERIEIVKGDGSSSYGPNAIGGVINIITKKGDGKSAAIQLTGGRYGFYDVALSGSYGFNSINNHFSFSKKKSDGYRDNTNFEAVNASYGSSVLLGEQLVNFFLGYNDKKFGANSFYSDKYPNQWEHTRTKLASVSGEVNAQSFVLSPKIYWRRNDDEYLLNYMNPSFYRNVHKTNVYGAELQVAFQTALGTTALGGEYNRDVIASSNLGDHSRERKGLFAEQKLAVKNVNATVGFFTYNYENIGWKFWPGVSIGYNIFPDARIYASYGKAFRLPSYTELYYNYFVTAKNGTQKGNTDLQTEESSNYEVGIHFTKEKFSSSFSFFRRSGSNSIDWGKATTDSVWHSYNIVNTMINGFELNADFNLEELSFQALKRITIGYTYLNIDASLNRENFQSRYVLDHLRHQLIVGITNALFLDITQSWMLRYENRITGDRYFLVDSQINKRFLNVDLFVKATNLFNKSYKDFTGVFLPGRWLFAGAKVFVN